MNKNVVLFGGLMLVSLNVLSQNKSSNLSISGQLRVLIGTALSIPSEAVIVIEQPNIVQTTDSLGDFRFNNLDSGTYKIKVVGYNNHSSDTVIELKNEPIHNLKLIVRADCDINGDLAEQDIKNKYPKLLLASGIAPVIYSKQYIFEKKYNIKYYDYGCVPPAIECIIQYNLRIFKYLDSKFGPVWRNTVRKDVIGLQKKN